jgi:hypothetical protein
MLRALVFCDIRDAWRRAAILDHVSFLEHAPPDEVAVTYVNMASNPPFDPAWFGYDVVILHTTVLCWRWSNEFESMSSRFHWIRQFEGVTVAMPQDDYDHAHVLDDWLADLNVQIVVSICAASAWPLLYPRMHTRAFFIEALTGYLHPGRIAPARASAMPLADRPRDVVYRANNLPFWFGWLGNMKSRIGTDGGRLVAERTSLRADISVRPEDTVLGDAWFDFLGSSQTVLGSEGGSSVLDRRGEVKRHVQALLADQPSLSFDEVNALTGGELTRHHFAMLGPRHLESIMTGTVQVLVEGAYLGLFRPWEHYIPIKSDFSDLHELPERLADRAMVQRIADQATADFVESGAYGYDKLASHVLDVIKMHVWAKPPRMGATTTSGGAFALTLP